MFFSAGLDFNFPSAEREVLPREDFFLWTRVGLPAFPDTSATGWGISNTPPPFLLEERDKAGRIKKEVGKKVVGRRRRNRKGGEDTW